MAINYKCPHCNGYLDLSDCVVLSVQTSSGQRGLISLHSDLGNYNITKHDHFILNEGEELGIYCPICHEGLASTYHPNLARVIMIDDKGNEFEIHFSRKTGEHSTYKIVGETMEIYGDDSAEYIDFLNLSMNF